MKYRNPYKSCLMFAIMERVINNNSFEFFEEIIKTVPIIPRYFAVNMKIGGIPLPKNSDELGEYISLLEGHGVIPFSYARLVNRGKVFSLEDASFIYPCELSSANLSDLLVLHMAKGGRPHTVTFDAMQQSDNTTPGEAFLKFRKKFLEAFLEQGYRLNWGKMVVGSKYEGRGYLLFSRDGERTSADGLYLGRLEGMVETEEIKIKEWLSDLKEKYNSN